MNKKYDKEKENDKIRKWKTGNEINNLLSGVEITSMGGGLFTVSVFDEVEFDDTRGIGVFYPLYLDGSCAEAQYIVFHYVKEEGLGDIVILEKANEEEIQEYETAKLSHLLRR